MTSNNCAKVINIKNYLKKNAQKSIWDKGNKRNMEKLLCHRVMTNLFAKIYNLQLNYVSIHALGF